MGQWGHPGYQHPTCIPQHPLARRGVKGHSDPGISSSFLSPHYFFLVPAPGAGFLSPRWGCHTLSTKCRAGWGTLRAA